MKKEFVWQTEQFDDIKILRYQVPAFETLSARERIFIYYLSRAALAGRDILWDQNNKYNLKVREALERIIRDYPGDRLVPEFQHFMIYAKKVFLPTASITIILWINSGRVFPKRISGVC